MKRLIIDNLEEFVQIDKRIDTHEENAADSLRESIRDRWEFGRLMLAGRKGKQLPKGMLDELVAATGKGRSELQYRMQFAERYPTEDKVSTALDTFKSWTQVKRNLPPPPTPTPPTPPTPTPTPTPTPPTPTPTPQPQRGEVMGELIDWTTVTGTAREKAERMSRSIQRQMHKEYQAKLEDALAIHKAKLDADSQSASKRARELRDEERRRYQQVLDARKGIFTKAEYNLIRSCLHPDSRMQLDALDKKLDNAFRVFNEAAIKLLNERDFPTRSSTLPPTTDGLKRRTPRRAR